MSKIFGVISFVILIFSPFCCWAEMSSPRYSVSDVLYEWKDEKRNREIPVKIYYPQGISTPVPVIIFSHGLGGSREGYAYIGKYWASCGYVSVHLQHEGSDTGAIFSGMRRAASPKNSTDRVEDVKYALDYLPSLNTQDGPLQGKMDLEKIGMGGHSFGALTTQVMIGQLYQMGKSAADSRIKAGVILSPTLMMNKFTDYEKLFSPIMIPSFHMTGTEDTSPMSSSMTAADRRVPYDHISNADKYLTIFSGGDHMVFSGRGSRRPGRVNEEKLHDLICKGTTAFWDAYLRGDSQAKAWLSNEGYGQQIASSGTFEKKLK